MSQPFYGYIDKTGIYIPLLTDSKTFPPQAYENTRKIGGRSTVHKGLIVSTYHQWGRKENPTDGSFNLSFSRMSIYKVFPHW